MNCWQKNVGKKRKNNLIQRNLSFAVFGMHHFPFQHFLVCAFLPLP